ncbi:hypothetical protein QI633_08155 [Nocardioides sp. QY071]|uniref:hypothetical protein n=1 Tax=Nocardioides sp. QY071 TaxID=3044187 RepID=UPI002499FEE2|nr:hypothetical protein [Nocardioides sp. QY071]WGY03725.1 hypothetical protein QI633_08155 [Nocardioides sp. QY071]
MPIGADTRRAMPALHQGKHTGKPYDVARSPATRAGQRERRRSPGEQQARARAPVQHEAFALER